MRCPVCRAENNEGNTCRRCKADLTLLIRIDDQRERAAVAATQHLAAGSAAAALAEATQMHVCRPAADSWRLLALANLANRAFAEALRCYHEATKQQS